MKIEEINTERYILRKIEKSDCDDVYRLLSNPDIVENLNMNIHTKKEDTESLIEDYLKELKEGKKYPYAIIEKDTKKFIGVFLIKLDLYDEDCFEFTIYLDKDFWGRGIYTEVLPCMEEVAFEKIKTGNFRGFVMEKNKASSRVLEKCDFLLEKVFEVPGIEGKIESYLITKDEYFNKKDKIQKGND